MCRNPVLRDVVQDLLHDAAVRSTTAAVFLRMVSCIAIQYITVLFPYPGLPENKHGGRGRHQEFAEGCQADGSEESGDTGRRTIDATSSALSITPLRRLTRARRSAACSSSG